MKLLRAKFENFRLLRDLEIDFSIDTDRNLTVIRAANDTGKTTILTALQWGLYGDSALPRKGEDFRLHPIDWSSDGERVPITVTIDFEVTKYRSSKGRQIESNYTYRIIRSAYEEVSGSDWQRTEPSVSLFQLTSKGAEPIDAPDSMINEELPPELREVFFTDGDRALSFIEADVSLTTKRHRVQKAIRSLLGLGVLEDALSHVKKTAAEVNKSAKRMGASGELGVIAAQLEQIESDIAKCEAGVKDANEQFIAFEEKIEEIDKRIARALVAGDKEKLQEEYAQSEKNLAILDKRIEESKKKHSSLFRGESLARDLLQPALSGTFRELDSLRDAGKIPNTTILVLEDQLKSNSCFCGETLNVKNTDGKRRRKHIEKIIHDSRQADEIQGILTELYYGAKSLQPPVESDTDGWIDEFAKIVEERDDLASSRELEGKKYRTLGIQIDNLEDTDVKGLRETRRQYISQRDRFLQKGAEYETKLTNARRDHKYYALKREKYLRKQEQGDRILAELEVINDIQHVLKSAYERITNEELSKVSDLMNKVFLEMIGSDPEQRAIIKQAIISKDFDIIVFGPANRTLNPDRDLNGASRRALTLAFILALTKVSEVVAPNVIDTPLGTMSDYVKRSVLRSVRNESAQVILFLTIAEIEGCEQILDEFAGKVFTLTNPAHYPVILVNDPGVEKINILRCDCDHRGNCQLCDRRFEAEGIHATA